MNMFFTWLSDFHKLLLSVFKTTFCKSKPKEITYRHFKNFEEESFNQELRNNLINNNIIRKAIVRRSNLQIINFTKRTPESLKNVRNKRTTIVSYIKKNARGFLVIWIQAIFLIIKHFGSTFSRFFLINKQFQIKSL